MNKAFFRGKKVLVMGLGRFGGGVDAAKFVCQAGAQVIVTDTADAEKLAESINQLKEFPKIEYHLGSHCAVDFTGCDVVIVNPAVRPENELLAVAQRTGATITSQIEIFFELCPAYIIGITGSNGKSTTTALTAHLLSSRRQKTEDRRQKAEVSSIGNRVSSIGNVWLGGNLGDMLLLARLDQIKPCDIVVLELSSFQLEQLAQSNTAPNLALITNLAPNHLDRHGTFENYCHAKENIFALQRPSENRPGENRPAVSIFNADDPLTLKWYEKYKSQDGRECLTFSHKQVSKSLRESFALPGRANLENLAAATAIAEYFGLEQERLKEAVATFRSLPHRLEFVAEMNGTAWYDDSVSTTPESSIVALDAFSQPKVIIAGGYDKGAGFEQLGRQIAQKAKAAVLIGKTSEKIEKAILATAPARRDEDTPMYRDADKYTENTKIKLKDKIIIRKAGNLSDAVRLSAELAGPGEVVLLSPGCASYDMFDDFRHRGEAFKNCIEDVKRILRLSSGQVS